MDTVTARVRFGLTRGQRRPFLLAVVGYEALVGLDVLVNGGRHGGGWGTAGVGVLLLAMAAAFRWVGVSLSREGAQVHAIPGMRIPWPDVHAVEVESALGIRTIVLHHGRGRRTRLNAPTTGLFGVDEQFPEKVATIRAFWSAHREPARG